MRAARVLLVGALACACAASTCQDRPMTGVRGCLRQTDCLGGERCEESVCVSSNGTSSGGSSSGASSSGDAGPPECVATTAGCTDDVLNNRAATCPTPLLGTNNAREDLVACAGTTDHFVVDIPQGGGFQALAWPSVPANVALQMNAQGAEPAITEVGSTTVADSVAYASGAALAAGTRIIAASSPTTTTGYAFQVRTGRACTVDADCQAAGRVCQPLFFDPGTVTGFPVEAFGRGGICVDPATSPCGEVSATADTRTTAADVRVSRLDAGIETYGAGPFTAETCILDQDWWRLAPDLPAFHLKATLSCTSTDPAFRPMLLVVNEAGDLEWQVLFTPIPDTNPWPSGTSFIRSIGYLPGGAGAGANAAHYVMLRQVAGRTGGTCALNLEVTPDACLADTNCTSRDNPRMLRTTCVAPACFRAP